MSAVWIHFLASLQYYPFCIYCVLDLLRLWLNWAGLCSSAAWGARWERRFSFVAGATEPPAKTRIKVNFSLSPSLHITYFPLVWIDVGKMIADDFQKFLHRSTETCLMWFFYELCLFFATAGRKLHFRYLNVPTSSVWSEPLTNTVVTAVTTPTDVLHFSRAINNSVKHFKKEYCALHAN